MAHRSAAPSPLAKQVSGLVVPKGHLAVWALGQQGYLLKGGEQVVIIDPYLSNFVQESTPGQPNALARQVPIVVQPQELTMVNLALCTHDHADHCDPDTVLPLLEASPQARVLTSYKGRDLLAGHGVNQERIEVPTVEKLHTFGQDLHVTAIPSAHYTFEPDEHGNPAYLGFIIAINGVSLYHCGDTVIYTGMVERLQAQPINIMCLPVNGRDWFREQQGLLGNMDYREAAELGAAVGIDVLLPGHNDMFAGNKINPAYLLDYLATHHPLQKVHFLRAGELFYYVGQSV